MLSSHNVILQDREILGGTLVFRGTRVPLQTLVDSCKGGQTGDEFLDHFPTVTRQGAVEALEHAKTPLISELG